MPNQIRIDANCKDSHNQEKSDSEWAKKLGHYNWRLTCLHIQNAWSNLHDFWHTSTPFYSDICWFHIQEIHHTKWHHLNS